MNQIDSDVIDLVYENVALGLEIVPTDTLVAHIDDLLCKGEFGRVSTILLVMDEHLPRMTMTAVLMVTHPCTQVAFARKSLYDKTVTKLKNDPNFEEAIVTKTLERIR